LLSRDRGFNWKNLSIDDFFFREGGGLAASWREREFSHVVGVPGTARIFLGTFTGVYRSDDHGESWLELDTITRHIKGLSVVKAPKGQVRLSTCTYGGFCWSGVADLKPLRNGSKSKFPDEFMTQLSYEDARTEYNNVAFSPSPTGIGFIYLVTKGYKTKKNFFFRTTDNFAGGLNIFPNTNSNMSMVDLPLSSPEKNYVVHAIEFSPTFAIDGIMFVGGVNIGICKSTDYGLTFQTILELPNRMVTQIVLSPKFAINGIIFTIVKNVDERTANIYISEDSGKKWKMIPGSEKEWRSISLTIDTTGKYKKMQHALVGVVSNESFHGSVLVMRQPQYKTYPLNIPWKYKGINFSRDSNLRTQDGKLLLGMVGGGALEGKLKGKNFVSIKIRGNDQRWTFGESSYFSEGTRKLFSHIVAKSPHYTKDGTIFGASHYEIYASHNRGKTWNLVYTLPFMAPRYSGSNRTLWTKQFF